MDKKELEKYKVQYKNKIRLIKPFLVKERNIDDETLEKIKKEKIKEYKIINDMEHTSGDEYGKLYEYLKEYRKINYKLQQLWGFKKDYLTHRDFLLPHCECPKDDNQFEFGYNRYVCGDCPVHKLEIKKSK